DEVDREVDGLHEVQDVLDSVARGFLHGDGVLQRQDGLRGRDQDEEHDHDGHQRDGQDVRGARRLLRPVELPAHLVGEVDLPPQAHVEVEEQDERDEVPGHGPRPPVA
ncbi:hypothetical protein EGW08_007252, partial [Elysia chlorotica]